MTDWTEPDRSEERWSQPWEEWRERDSWFLEDFPTPMFGMAFQEWLWSDFSGEDFYAPRARWVSDR